MAPSSSPGYVAGRQVAKQSVLQVARVVGAWVWASPLHGLLVTVGDLHSHRDTAAKIEAAARRALLASNASYVLLSSLVDGRVALETQRELEDR